jgi:hypothetical protein
MLGAMHLQTRIFPGLVDLLPHGLAPHESSTADLHAGGGVVDVAPTHTDAALPDLVSLTGHDWFVHT